MAAKILRHAVALGGIFRSTFQLDAAALPLAKLRQATELLGARAAPLLRAGT